MSNALDQLWRKAGAAFRRGDLDAAETHTRALLARNPRHAGALHELGLIEYQRGRRAEAVPLLREAVRLGPADESAHFNLGVVLYELGDPAASVVSHRQAVALRADYAEAWSALSASLYANGDFADAAAAARRAMELAPHLVSAYANLSVALKRLGDEAGALEVILVCVRRSPDVAEAWFWMGQTLHLRREMTAALSAYERAIAIEPGHILAHARRAISWLTLGDLEHGWPEYEWRLRSPGADLRRLAQPRWNGDALVGRTILVHAEQGLGDAIQMLRYVEPLAANAEAVVVEVDAALLPLVPRRNNVIPLARGEDPPEFDVYCPLFSLPLAFGTTLETVPGRPSYLRPDPVRVSAWEQILAASGPGRRVGLVWAGNRRHLHDRERSLSFDVLAPLLALGGIVWLSVQVGGAAREAASSRVIDLAPRLHDFGETAAVMTQLDLVITVDTAVAHLAGSLGVPVWILLPFVPDFRWMLDREDSPWYPSARLFRQRTPGDWAEVIDRVAQALTSRG